MINTLEELLKQQVGKRPLFMCHLIAGYPSRAESEKVARALIDSGVDILEIQIPFSDPMADGPSIAVASQEALAAGATVKNSLALVQKISKNMTPVVIMSYLNPVFRYGISAFVRDAARVGASALIIPDAPFDSGEGKELILEAKKQGLCMIPVISPGVPRKRLLELSKDASGFAYCTSRQGTTGANSRFVADLRAYIQEAREAFSIPVGLGFGIQTRNDFKRAADLADIVIAGSVFVNAIKKVKKGSAASAVRKTMKIIRG